MESVSHPLTSPPRAEHWGQASELNTHLSLSSPILNPKWFAQVSDWTQTFLLLLFQRVDNVNLDVSDEEEIREQMDMHSIIVSCINDEPFLTAEQVLSEMYDFWSEL